MPCRLPCHRSQGMGFVVGPFLPARFHRQRPSLLIRTGPSLAHAPHEMFLGGEPQAATFLSVKVFTLPPSLRSALPLLLLFPRPPPQRVLSYKSRPSAKTAYSEYRRPSLSPSSRLEGSRPPLLAHHRCTLSWPAFTVPLSSLSRQLSSFCFA